MDRVNRIMGLLWYKFLGLYFISPLTKNTHMSPHIILSTHKYFPHIIQIFSMILGSHKFSYIKPYKLPLVLSQILPGISHISSNLNSPQINSPHITTKIGWQNYIIPTQGPTSFSLWAKPKKSPNSLKSHYDVVNSKPATMWHYLLSPLLHGISKAQYDQASLKARYDPTPLKARCYMAPFTKPIATRQYFTKSQNHFS